ncbi:MAG: hypothetical protein AB8G15_14490 [Saprospiraceae bacterium]
MEQQIITLVNERIHALFAEVKNTLLQQDSYTTPVDTQNLFHYFSFLETALHLPYNRLASLTAFINNDASLLSDLMYPLAMLKIETKQVIQQKSKQAGMLANGLDVSGIDPDFLSLVTEKHSERSRK